MTEVLVYLCRLLSFAADRVAQWLRLLTVVQETWVQILLGAPDFICLFVCFPIHACLRYLFTSAVTGVQFLF